MDDQIELRVGEEDADAERLEALAEALRAELLALDVGDVAPLRVGPAPPGTRAVDLATAGALLVSVKGSVELIRQLVTTVRAWLGRGDTARSVEITIGDKTLRISHASSEEQHSLVEQFLRSVAAG